MIEAVDLSQIVACAPRPEGSWAHLLGLVGFVLAAAWLAPGTTIGMKHSSDDAQALPDRQPIA